MYTIKDFKKNNLKEQKFLIRQSYDALYLIGVEVPYVRLTRKNIEQAQHIDFVLAYLPHYYETNGACVFNKALVQELYDNSRLPVYYRGTF